jgi:hypothetical protein
MRDVCGGGGDVPAARDRIDGVPVATVPATTTGAAATTAEKAQPAQGVVLTASGTARIRVSPEFRVSPASGDEPGQWRRLRGASSGAVLRGVCGGDPSQ